jgi:hypothetical protein
MRGHHGGVDADGFYYDFPLVARLRPRTRRHRKACKRNAKRDIRVERKVRQRSARSNFKDGRTLSADRPKAPGDEVHQSIVAQPPSRAVTAMYCRRAS